MRIVSAWPTDRRARDRSLRKSQLKLDNDFAKLPLMLHGDQQFSDLRQFILFPWNFGPLIT